MTNESRRLKPKGFGLCTRIVYVHQAICCVLFVAGLRLYPLRGLDELLLPHLAGIALSASVLVAMFGVATRKSCKALFFLRLILWIGVVKILVVQLWLLAEGQSQLTADIRAILINELLAIPLAIYWSRPIHQSYLNSFRSSGASSAA